MEDHKKLIDDFEKARKELHDKSAKDGKQFHKFETLYGEAYQKLVTAGLKPKLRTKYRPK
jgi:SPX domain protein involved in polyphosphate accumulation